MNATRSTSSTEQTARTRIRTKRSWNVLQPEKADSKAPAVKPRVPKPTGVDAQELRVRLEAYIAQNGAHVLGTQRYEDDEEVGMGSSEMKSNRMSAYVEEIPEKRRSQYDELPNSSQYVQRDANRDTYQTLPSGSSHFVPLRLPELEFLDNSEPFNPHLLSQVEEEEEPQDLSKQPLPDQPRERPQSQSPTATLRRVTPLEDPRKTYKSHQRTFELGPYSTKQRSSSSTDLPYSTHNELRMIDEAFNRRTSLRSLSREEGSKSTSKITRFSDERQVWNGTDKLEKKVSEERNNSLPWSSTSTKDSGVGLDTSAKPENSGYGDSATLQRRSSLSWRLKGRKERRDSDCSMAGSEQESSSPRPPKKSSLRFLNLFQR